MRDIVKKSWPWTGSQDHNHGDTFGDVTVDSNDYDMLSPEKASSEYEIYGYSEGKMSPVDVDGDGLSSYVEDQDSVDNEGELLARIISILNKKSSLLNINGNTSGISKKGLDIFNIDNKANKDLRYYNFGKKFDILHVFDYSSKNDNLFFKNIYSQMRPLSYGSIYLKNNEKLKHALSSINNAGFSIIKTSDVFVKNKDNIFSEIIIKKNDLDKIACVTIYSDFSNNICPVSLKKVENGVNSHEYGGQLYRLSSQDSLDRFKRNPDFYLNNKVSFTCDVASTNKEKLDGLQPYSKLNYGSGLLFKYKKPTDVMYHMGSVRFPIDILFIDKDNKIKKMYKNIQPGSVAVFGCSDVSNVLEVPGGVSNHLGIYEGKYIDIKMGSIGSGKNKVADSMLEASVDNNIKMFAKISSAYNFGSYSYYNNKIVSLNNNILKTSSMGRPISNIYGTPGFDRNISIFDLDSIGIGDSSNPIKLYSRDNGEGFVEVGVESILEPSPIGLRYKIEKGYKKSFYNFISNNGILSNDDNEFFTQIIKKSNNYKEKIVFVTRLNLDDAIGEVIAKKIEDQYGLTSLNIDYDVLHIDKESGSGDILDIVKQKYRCISPTLYISKSAGIAVPTGTKNVAEECVSDIDKILSYLETVKNNFEHNVSEYEKIQGDSDLIRKTKGMYNQSSIETKKSVEGSLRAVLRVLKSMDGIKDVSTTTEIIDSVASSTKIYIEYVQNVFDLIDKFDDINFFSILSENTSASLSAMSDCEEALSRMKNYIYNDIMGIVPLSE